MQKILLTVASLIILSNPANAQSVELKCFASDVAGEEIQLSKNEMTAPSGFPHLKGQSFEKVVQQKDGSLATLNLTLRDKQGKTFDFRISSADYVHFTAALDDNDMFQYTNYSKGIAVLCTKDY